MRVGIIAATVISMTVTDVAAQPPPQPPLSIQLTTEQLTHLWGKVCPEDCQRTQVLMQDIQRQVAEQMQARQRPPVAPPKTEE